MMSISLSLSRFGSSTLSKQDHCQEHELVTILSSGEHTPKEPDKLSSSGGLFLKEQPILTVLWDKLLAHSALRDFYLPGSPSHDSQEATDFLGFLCISNLKTLDRVFRISNLKILDFFGFWCMSYLTMLDFPLFCHLQITGFPRVFLQDARFS